jgi:hypothetical protein
MFSYIGKKRKKSIFGGDLEGLHSGLDVEYSGAKDRWTGGICQACIAMRTGWLCVSTEVYVYSLHFMNGKHLRLQLCSHDLDLEHNTYAYDRDMLIIALRVHLQYSTLQYRQQAVIRWRM